MTVTKRTTIWVVLALSFVLLVTGTISLLVVAPMVIYQQAKDDTDTRIRTRDISRLLTYGPLGRAYALELVRERFLDWREHGSSFAIIPRVFPIGTMSAELYAVLGAPDIHSADRDIWWVGRDDTGRRMLSTEEPGRTQEWNMRLVGEYDQEGRLERLFIPGWITDTQSQMPAPERSSPPLESPPPVDPSELTR